MLLGTTSLLLLLRARENPSPERVAAWVLVCILALLTHYFAAFLVAAECLALVVAHRSRATIAGGFTAIAAGLALAPLAVAQRENSQFLAGSELTVRAKGIPKEFLLGGRGAEVDAPWVVAIAGLLVLAAAALVLLALYRNRLSPGLRLCGALALWVLLAPLALDILGLHLVTPRNLILAIVPALVVVAAALVDVRWVGLAGAAGLLTLGLGICLWTNVEPTLQREAEPQPLAPPSVLELNDEAALHHVLSL